MLIESGRNSTIPQFSPVDRISYVVSFNLSFLFLKMESIVSINCMANCSDLRSSPLFTMTRRSRQVFKCPNLDAFLILCSCS